MCMSGAETCSNRWLERIWHRSGWGVGTQNSVDSMLVAEIESRIDRVSGLRQLTDGMGLETMAMGPLNCQMTDCRIMFRIPMGNRAWNQHARDSFLVFLINTCSAILSYASRFLGEPPCILANAMHLLTKKHADRFKAPVVF